MKSLGQAGDERLWWYHFGEAKTYPLDKFLYFGRWCIEAVAVAKAFGIDDRLCLAHPNYLGDLIEDGRSPRYPLDAESATILRDVKFGSASKKSRLSDWIIRILTGKPPLNR